MNHFAPRKQLATKVDKAERVLLSFSTPTTKPFAKALREEATGVGDKMKRTLPRLARYSILAVLFLWAGSNSRANDVQTFADLHTVVETQWLLQLRAQGLGTGFRTNLTDAHARESQSAAVARLVKASQGRHGPEFFMDLVRLNTRGNASTNWSQVPRLFEEPDKWFVRAWPTPFKNYGRITDPKTVDVALGLLRRRTQQDFAVNGQAVPMDLVWLEAGITGTYRDFLGQGSGGTITFVEPGLLAYYPEREEELRATHTRLHKEFVKVFTEDGAEAERRAMELIRTNGKPQGLTVSALLFLRSSRQTAQPLLTSSYVSGLQLGYALRTVDLRSADHRLALEMFDSDVPMEFLMRCRSLLLASSQSRTPHLFLSYLVASAEPDPEWGRAPSTWDYADALLSRLASHVAHVRPDLAREELPGVKKRQWAVLARLARLSPEELCKLMDPFCREILAASLLDGVIEGFGGPRPMPEGFLDRITKLPGGYGVTNSLEVMCRVGEIFWMAKRWSEAETIFSEVARKVQTGARMRSLPEAAWVSHGFVRLGMGFRKQDNIAQADRMFEIALKIDAGNAMAMYSIAEHLFVKGDYRQAISMLEKALSAEQQALPRQKLIENINALLKEARRLEAAETPKKK